VPLYRYWNGSAGDHFYTTNWNELQWGKYGWVFEGIQCWVVTQVRPPEAGAPDASQIGVEGVGGMADVGSNGNGPNEYTSMATERPASFATEAVGDSLAVPASFAPTGATERTAGQSSSFTTGATSESSTSSFEVTKGMGSGVTLTIRIDGGTRGG
jgi:hypothetical protein